MISFFVHYLDETCAYVVTRRFNKYHKHYTFFFSSLLCVASYLVSSNMSSENNSSTEDLSKSSEESCSSGGSAVETKSLDYKSPPNQAASVVDPTATTGMTTYQQTPSVDYNTCG
jgi:hypothetical protein